MDILFNLLVSLVVAIVTAYFTVKFSLKQFYSQKWWEKKSDAYSKIIEQLSFILYYFGQVWDSYALVNGPSQSKLLELSIKYHDALDSLKQSVLSAGFIITEESSKELEDLIKKLDDIEEEWVIEEWQNRLEGTVHEPFDQQYNAIQKSIIKIKKIAARDLSKN
jgi:hypothetical protein